MSNNVKDIKIFAVKYNISMFKYVYSNDEESDRINISSCCTFYKSV